MVTIETDTARDELRASRGQVTALGPWIQRGELHVQADANGVVVSLVLPNLRQRAGNLMVLADLIAQTLGVERDEAVQEVRDAIARNQ